LLPFLAYYILLAVIAGGSYFYKRMYNNLTERNKELLQKKNLIELETKGIQQPDEPAFHL
jgi:hypothetical protein